MAEDTLTIVYSDSSLKRLQRTDALPTALLGYLITSPGPGELVPRRVDMDFSVRVRGDTDYIDMALAATSTVASTATSSNSLWVDDNFLHDARVNLPFTAGDLEGTRAARGTQLWDLLAYVSALLKAERSGITGPLLVRTDGDLPEWMRGIKPVTLDVRGRNVGPDLVNAVRQVEGRFSAVHRETVTDLVIRNRGEEPIRRVIDDARERARRADYFPLR